MLESAISTGKALRLLVALFGRDENVLEATLLLILVAGLDAGCRRVFVDEDHAALAIGQPPVTEEGCDWKDPWIGSPTFAVRRACLDSQQLETLQASWRLSPSHASLDRLKPLLSLKHTLHHDMGDRTLDPAILAGTSSDTATFPFPSLFRSVPDSERGTRALTLLWLPPALPPGSEILLVSKHGKTNVRVKI